MPILNSIKAAATSALQSVRSLFSGFGGGLWGGASYLPGSSWGAGAYLPGARVNYRTAAGDLWLNSVVAICLAWIGDNFPKPILRVSRIKRDGTYEPVGRHPLPDLIGRPNPHYTGRTLGKALSLSLKVDGNAYLWKVRSKGGAVVELWWLPHWLVSPVWPTDGSAFIDGYVYNIDGQIHTIPAADIIHFRDGIDPRNDRLGLAPLKAQLREVCTDNEASTYTASILRNMGVGGMLVMPKAGGGITQTQAEQLKSKIEDATTGENRGRPTVLSGEVQVTTFGMTPEEMRLDSIPKSAMGRITAALGVSPMVVGLEDPSKTYSNYGVAISAAWRHALVPLQDLVAETLRWQLLDEFSDPYSFIVEYDYNGVEALQEDQTSKSERIREEFKVGLITQNEGRDQLGYPADVDGDRFASGTGGPTDQPAVMPPQLVPPQPAAPDAALASNRMAALDGNGKAH